MKRKLLVGLVMAIILSLCACGSGDNTGETDKKDATQNESTTSDNQKVSDKENKKESKNKGVSLEALESMEVSPLEDFEFRRDGDVADGLQLCGYKGNDEMVVLPEEVDGKKVVSISSMVFGEGSSVKAIKISDSVQRISASFMDNANLKYVIFGSGLKVVGDGSFANCESLEEVKLNEGVEKIGEAAFSIENLNYIYIPDTVKEISTIAIMTGRNEEVVIAGKAGSMAEEHAKQMGFIFEVVE